MAYCGFVEIGANDPNASLCRISHNVRQLNLTSLTQYKENPAEGQLANMRATFSVFSSPEDITVVFFVVVVRYLFEGVGFLVSSILVSNISEIKRINQNGIKKM